MQRFTMVDNFSSDEAGMDILDNYTGERYNEYHMLDVCRLLNKIHSENQNISKKEYGFVELSSFDKTMFLQCREYIKCYLLDEELKHFKDDDGEFKYIDLIEDNRFKGNLLLLELYASLMRLKSDDGVMIKIKKPPFIKIIDDYFIKYEDGELFNLHKPSDIRALMHILNRENGYDELTCEYNGEYGEGV